MRYDPWSRELQELVLGSRSMKFFLGDLVRFKYAHNNRLTTSVIICFGLLQWKTSTTTLTWSRVLLNNLTQRSDTSIAAFHLSLSALSIALKSGSLVEIM